jgi:hypothetical protein
MHRELELLANYPFPQSSIPYIERHYLPSSKEEKLWSRTIHVPMLVTPRATYRVREDYYNVFELYSQENVTIPDARLIGADVIVFDVEDKGEFAIIYEPITKKKHRIYFKMLRMRNENEPYLPCTWVYPNAVKYYGCGIAFQTDWKSPERRFTIKLTKKNEWEIKVKTTFSNYKHDVFTFQISDLRECLLAGLTLLSLRYGFWSEEEITLFNVVAQNKEYNLPEIELMLNHI